MSSDSFHSFLQKRAESRGINPILQAVSDGQKEYFSRPGTATSTIEDLRKNAGPVYGVSDDWNYANGTIIPNQKLSGISLDRQNLTESDIKNNDSQQLSRQMMSDHSSNINQNQIQITIESQTPNEKNKQRQQKVNQTWERNMQLFAYLRKLKKEEKRRFQGSDSEGTVGSEDSDSEENGNSGTSSSKVYRKKLLDNQNICKYEKSVSPIVSESGNSQSDGKVKIEMTNHRNLEDVSEDSNSSGNADSNHIESATTSDPNSNTVNDTISKSIKTKTNKKSKHLKNMPLKLQLSLMAGYSSQAWICYSSGVFMIFLSLFLVIMVWILESEKR